MRRTLLAFSFLLAACGGGSDKGAEVGDTAPTFATRDLSGERVRLADFEDETVVVNFWASWCVPCRNEFPLLARAHALDGVTVLGVVYNDSLDKARDFMRDYGGTWPGLRDDGSIAKAYRVGPGIPATVVIGPDGKVTQRHIGELRALDELRLPA